MKITLTLTAITFSCTLWMGALHADLVTTDFVTIADGRVQSSGSNGQELFTAEEDVLTLRSGANNISDGLFEFDLSSLPEDADIMAAEIRFRTAAPISNTNSSAVINFFGFTGNGSLELSDESAAATLVSVVDFTTSIGNDTAVSTTFSDLTAINSLLSDASADDFFALRSETVNFVAFRVDSLESSDLDSNAATLRLTYETSAIPEPSSAAMLSLILGSGFLRRVRKS